MPRGKVAVAVVHGIGDQETERLPGEDGEEVIVGFERRIKKKIHDRCRDECGPHVEDEIVIEGVHWADVLNEKQLELQESIFVDETSFLNKKIRDVAVRLAGDAIAYQDSKSWVYREVHTVFAKTLKRLAKKTAPNAPLCIIAHSLGTIVTSNYLYDLQVDEPYRQSKTIPQKAREVMGDNPTPLERGHTVSLLYTLGSPLALWSILYEDFGVPIIFPPPRWMHSDVGLPHEWVNYYDKDDVIGYPLRNLYETQNAKRAREGKEKRILSEVLRDEQVNVGGWFKSATPLSHMMYWEDNDVVEPIAKKLVETWQAVEDGKITLDYS